MESGIRMRTTYTSQLLFVRKFVLLRKRIQMRRGHETTQLSDLPLKLCFLSRKAELYCNAKHAQRMQSKPKVFRLMAVQFTECSMAHKESRRGKCLESNIQIHCTELEKVWKRPSQFLRFWPEVSSHYMNFRRGRREGRESWSIYLRIG